MRFWVTTLGGASLLLLASCAVGGTTGELEGNGCLDGVDNDGDGPVDCADAECQALEVCRDGQVGEPGAEEESVQPKKPEDEAVAKAPSAEPPPQTSVPEVASPPAAPPAETPSAAPEAPSPESPPSDPAVPCSPPECPDESPEPEPEAAPARIIRLSVAVPRSTNLASCLDTCLPVVPSEFFWTCGCPVDPFVRVRVDGVIAGETEYLPKRDSGEWMTDIALELGEESVVRLEALDYDVESAVSEEVIFACEFGARTDLAETLACTESFPTNLGPRQFKIEAEVDLGEDEQQLPASSHRQ